MKFYYVGALGLCISTVTHAQNWPAPDTTHAPPAAQIVKAGVRIFNQPDLIGSYERQLTPRLSLLGGLGYFRQRYATYGMWYTTASGQSQPEQIQGVSHSYHADLQLRYYFRRHTPHRPLTGWYASFAVQGTYRRSEEVYIASATSAAGSTTHYRTTRAQPQVYLGRQWALGSRVLLDTFLGTCVYRRESVNRRNANAPYLDAGGGLQLGWRL